MEKPQEGCFRRTSPCKYYLFPEVPPFIKPQKSPPNLTWHHYRLLNSCIPSFDTANSCAIRSMKNTWEYFLLERCNRNASHYKHYLMNSARKYLFCSSSKGSPGVTLSKTPSSIQQLHKDVLFFPSQEAILTHLLLPETAASVSSTKVLHLQY